MLAVGEPNVIRSSLPGDMRLPGLNVPEAG
jgi:hypothetical protein